MTDCVLYAYRLGQKSHGTKISNHELINWQPSDGKLWLHLSLSNEQTIQWLNNHSGLDEASIKTLTEFETRPRVIMQGEQLMVFLRALNTIPGQDPEDMLSLRIFTDGEKIITIQKRDVLAPQLIAKQLESGQGPSEPIALLLSLIDLITDRMFEVLDELEDAIEECEDQLNNPGPSTREDIADHRRTIVQLTRYLKPQRDALHKLGTLLKPTLDESDRYRLQEATERVIRYLEDLSSARDLTSILQEELSTRQTEILNRRMYQLSAVATLFLPLSFITGLLGVNVGGIPGAQHDQGFVLVCIILSVVCLMILAWFKKRSWF